MDEQTTVLIVDDDPDVRDILSAALFGQGYRLVLAENGQRMLEKAEEYRPDLIILDVMMPVLDGFEACRRLRQIPHLADIPVLILTALSDPNSRLAGIEAGADDFLSKPFDRIEIRTRVKAVTRLNRYRRILAERARFSWVVEHSKDSYLSVDEAGNIAYANDAARLLLSLPGDAEQLRHIHFIDQVRLQYTLMPPSAWDVWPKQVDPSLPMYMIRPQDERSDAIWYQVHVFDPTWQSGSRALVQITEVTSGVSFAQEVWSFQSVVSHKFNTPLSTILLASGLVRFFGEKLNTPELVEYAKAIEQGAKRLENEVNDVIQYISAPSLTRVGARFPLSELPGMVRQAAVDLELDDIYLDVENKALLGERVNLPERALKIILWEALENSKKFHPEHKPRIEVSLAQAADRRARLSIGDDGVSLPPDQLARAVIPYYQGEKTFTGETAGMGLGLATAASLLWGVKGDIRLLNRLDGPGVLLEIDLPLV